MNRQEYTLPCPNEESFPYLIYIPISWEICNDIPFATLWFSKIEKEGYHPYRGDLPTIPSDSICNHVHYLPIETDPNALLSLLVVSNLQERDTKEESIRVSLRDQKQRKVWLNGIEWISMQSLLIYSWDNCGHVIFPKWIDKQKRKKKMFMELTKDIDKSDYSKS